MSSEEKKITAKDLKETIKDNPNITEASLQESSAEIRDLATRPQPKITPEQKQSIEIATRKCIGRMGDGKVSEEQIQGLLSKMYGMKSVKEAMDYLTMSVSKVFGRPESKQALAESIQDILHIAPEIYDSPEAILRQLK